MQKKQDAGKSLEEQVREYQYREVRRAYTDAADAEYRARMAFEDTLEKMLPRKLVEDNYHYSIAQLISWMITKAIELDRAEARLRELDEG